MVRLTIDGVVAELESDAKVSLSYYDNELEGVKTESGSETITFELGSSVVNDAIFAADGYLHAAERFNAQVHAAVVEYEGQCIAQGELILKQVEWRDEMAYYTVEITTTAVGWALSAELGQFSAIDVDFSMRLNTGYISQTWSMTPEAVKFIAVHRDSYTYEPSSVSSDTVRRLRSIDDYHPFLHVATLFESIAQSGGYQLQSQLMESEAFQSLYMSGAYSGSSETSLASEKMDFYVKKMSSTTGTADGLGRVFMSNAWLVNTVGNIIDVDSIDEDSECYSRGGCLTIDGGTPTYTPLTQISVGFEYRIKYTTPYAIESRTKLKAFDTLYLYDATTVGFDIANRFDDRRAEVSPFFQYLLFIFDYTQDYTYRFWAYIDGASSPTLISTITAQSATVVTPYCSSVEGCYIEVSTSSAATNFETYSGDWALYDGYIEADGMTEVDITVRTPPQSASPTSPVEFVAAFIYGGESDWEFTLLEGSSVTPYFANYPGYGELIDFETIAQHQITQSEFMESIAHLYNLRFFTDRDAKVLYVEPYSEIYDSSTVWDWSDKIDTSMPIILTDLASEHNQNLKLGYQAWDGATNRGEYEDEEYDPADFGVWETTIESQAAAQSTTTSLNPIFSPSHNDDEDLLVVGDRDDEDLVDSLDFAPRIVSLCDMMTTDEGEMPYIAFHDVEREVSLCFEDRDGMSGLNRYYANEVELWQRGRVVTLYLKITPADFWALRTMVEGAPNGVSTFALRLGGEVARCRLKSVEGYDPSEQSTKCRFVVIS